MGLPAKYHKLCNRCRVNAFLKFLQVLFSGFPLFAIFYRYVKVIWHYRFSEYAFFGYSKWIINIYPAVPSTMLSSVLCRQRYVSTTIITPSSCGTVCTADCEGMSFKQ